MTWKLFVSASILSAALLLKAGAPFVTIVMGIAMAAFLNHRRQRRAIPKR